MCARMTIYEFIALYMYFSFNLESSLCACLTKDIETALYPFSSSLDKGTLYQLHSLIDRRSVVNDLKKDLHASQSLLSVVLEAQILKPMILYIFKKQIPNSAKEWMDFAWNSWQ